MEDVHKEEENSDKSRARMISSKYHMKRKTRLPLCWERFFSLRGASFFSFFILRLLISETFTILPSGKEYFISASLKPVKKKFSFKRNLKGKKHWSHAIPESQAIFKANINLIPLCLDPLNFQGLFKPSSPPAEVFVTTIINNSTIPGLHQQKTVTYDGN